MRIEPPGMILDVIYKRPEDLLIALVLIFLSTGNPGCMELIIRLVFIKKSPGKCSQANLLKK
jgi:hypothetical protein